MKERPIIFRGEMVRAILAGRKSQTRRLVRWPSWANPERDWPELVRVGGLALYKDGLPTRRMTCPYGAPRDRLWVREPWRTRLDQDHIAPRDLDPRWTHPTWVADHSDMTPSGCAGGVGKLRPSMFLPRKFSRIDLEVTEVRVQRLQEISEEDARAEGIAVDQLNHAIRPDDDIHWGGAVEYFAELWDSINGKKAPWSSNPWVWAISFRRLDR